MHVCRRGVGFDLDGDVLGVIRRRLHKFGRMVFQFLWRGGKIGGEWFDKRIRNY